MVLYITTELQLIVSVWQSPKERTLALSLLVSLDIALHPGVGRTRSHAQASTGTLDVALTLWKSLVVFDVIVVVAQGWRKVSGSSLNQFVMVIMAWH